MKDVLQKTLTAGVKTEFGMKLQRSRFLVKNFTDGSIKVSLGDNDTYSVIGAGSFECVFNNIADGGLLPDSTKSVFVTADSAGLVEVASVD